MPTFFLPIRYFDSIVYLKNYGNFGFLPALSATMNKKTKLHREFYKKPQVKWIK